MTVIDLLNVGDLVGTPDGSVGIVISRKSLAEITVEHLDRTQSTYAHSDLTLGIRGYIVPKEESQ